ncbi:MAG: helix-turn-helix domain-containing protein [Chryseobacterium sp.]|uniref:helix-turn-helix domain-containing protein n=1 Tax=Chryseobacterium sp. TaxID=1871047 RepID=UPI002835A8E2|nr:helix-turn-helix domain-containing protein [Chryseobacterium sp.]MDR2238074.1 helix-turn-helix domain-containing protein [Chryseobacterium sp.]
MKNTALLIFCLIFGFYYPQYGTHTKESIRKNMAATEDNQKLSMNERLDSFLKINKAAKSIGDQESIVKSSKKIMVLYYTLGDYEKALESTREVEEYAKKLNDGESIAAAYIERGTILSALGLSDENYKELQKALPYVNVYTDPNKKHYDLSLIYQGLAAGYYMPKKAHQDTILAYLKKSLHEVEQITDREDHLRQTEEKYHMISYLNMNLGMYYTGVYKPARFDLAERYLKRSLDAITKRKFTKVTVNKITVLNALGRFYSEQNMHKMALTYAKEVVQLEKTQKSPSDRMLAYATLTNSYEGLQDKDSTLVYMKLYTNLSDSLNYINTIKADATMKNISSRQSKTHEKDVYTIVIALGMVILLILFGGWLFWKKKQKKLHEKYNAVINHLKSNKNNEQEAAKVHDTVNLSEKSISITDGTVAMILSKLERFEKSQKFIKKDLSLTSLANELNTNTRYLSEIIKQYKGKNYNSYINSLRIDYITNKLYENPIYREYKISYLAEASGFSSREVFAVIFKKETGVSPSYFINSLKKGHPEAP